MANSGFGSTITFSSGFFAEITNISWGGIEREPLETTHMTTTDGKRTFIPSDLSDAGEITVEGHCDEDTAPPYTSAAETVTLTFKVRSGNSSGATWAASGFMTSFDMDDPMDGIISFTGTVKLSAAITVTAGS